MELLALSSLRAVIGLLFVLHGVEKTKTLPEFTAWMKHLKVPFPGLSARLAAYTELIGGALLTFGLFSPFPEAALIFVMLVAVKLALWTRNWSAQRGGWEYNAVLIASLAVLAAYGSLIGPSATVRFVSENWQPALDAIWHVGQTGTGV